MYFDLVRRFPRLSTKMAEKIVAAVFWGISVAGIAGMIGSAIGGFLVAVLARIVWGLIKKYGRRYAVAW